MLSEQTCSLIENLVSSLTNVVGAMNIRIIAPKLNGDLRALMLAYSSSAPLAVPPTLLPTLEHLLNRTRQALQTEQEELSKKTEPQPPAEKSAETIKEEAPPSTTTTKEGKITKSILISPVCTFSPCLPTDAPSLISACVYRVFIKDIINKIRYFLNT